MAQAPYGLLLDLAHALAGEAKLVGYLLQGFCGLTQAKERLEDVALPVSQGGQRTLNLTLQALLL